MPLDDLAFDQLAVGFERKADQVGALGDREPVPALDRAVAGVEEALVDQGLGQRVGERDLDGLALHRKRQRGRARGRLAIDGEQRARAHRLRAAQRRSIAHAAGPVVPEADRRDHRHAGVVEARTLTRGDLVATAAAAHDGRAGGDVDLGRTALQLQARAALGERDLGIAERVRRGLDALLERRCVEPHAAALDHQAATDHDLGLLVEERPRAVGQAHQRACALTGADPRALGQRRARQQALAAAVAHERHLARGQLELGVDAGCAHRRLGLPRLQHRQRDAARDHGGRADHHQGTLEDPAGAGHGRGHAGSPVPLTRVEPAMGLPVVASAASVTDR
ncbi:MAG: hypothetical protein U0168_03585 [Nannocystaceae bacterium]